MASVRFHLHSDTEREDDHRRKRLEAFSAPALRRSLTGSRSSNEEAVFDPCVGFRLHAVDKFGRVLGGAETVTS